ncbi:MAG: zinc ribbon domain-containing protein [Chloroflexi bacterium]|nr:zinc ribbon domain-containing protein [Chloroflexota bacterium]
MPVYGFRCTACGHEFDLTRRFSESGDPATCPLDGAEANRVFSVPTVFSMGGGAVGAAAPDPLGGPTSPGPNPRQFGHGHGGGGHGHSHGPGTAPHSHQ